MNRSLLLIEDDDDIRETLAGVLTVRGYGVTAARNGIDALRLIRIAQDRPSVILLDLTMPEMDGEAFLAAQATEPLLAGVPVIIVTAELDPPDPMPPQVRCVLRKPVALPALLAAINADD
jgi:two-component system, OmpR family, response regulator CpxR